MEVYKINENKNFNKMTQNMIQNVQSSGLNIDDFYSQVKSFLISIQEIEINDEILGKIIPLFGQLQKMVEDHIDISFLPKSLLTFLFDIPSQIISQSSMQDINLEDQSFQLQLHFMISFLDFLNSFLCNSSDNICYEFRESNYVSTLINILNQSKISLVLYKTILCFISLFDSKPQLGSTIPHDIYSHLYNCYLDINEINKDLKSPYPPRKIFYMENPTMSLEMQKLTINCSAIEALTNFEIHLLSLYRLVVQENPNRSPAQLEAMLSRLLDSIGKTSELGEIQTYKIKFVFNMYERIFSSADPIIIKSYMNFSFIETITSFFNDPSELELDKNILICLTKIASLSETSGYMILKSNFVSYRPNFTNDKSLILLYCNTWYTIISNMKNKKPSRLLFAINKGYEALKQCSEAIIDITQSILDAYKNDLDFELIKATTLIHIVLINLNDIELIKLIFDRLPDICKRIRDLIEAADSDNINQIVKSIDILFTLNESQGGLDYPAFNGFFTLDLVESIDDIIQNITDVDFDFDSIRIVLDKIRSKDTQF